MSVSFKIENWKCPGNYGIVKSGYVAFLWGEPWLQSLEEYCMEFFMDDKGKLVTGNGHPFPVDINVI